MRLASREDDVTAHALKIKFCRAFCDSGVDAAKSEDWLAFLYRLFGLVVVPDGFGELINVLAYEDMLPKQ